MVRLHLAQFYHEILDELPGLGDGFQAHLFTGCMDAMDLGANTDAIQSAFHNQHAELEAAAVDFTLGFITVGLLIDFFCQPDHFRIGIVGEFRSIDTKGFDFGSGADELSQGLDLVDDVVFAGGDGTGDGGDHPDFVAFGAQDTEIVVGFGRIATAGVDHFREGLLLHVGDFQVDAEDAIGHQVDELDQLLRSSLAHDLVRGLVASGCLEGQAGIGDFELFLVIRCLFLDQFKYCSLVIGRNQDLRRGDSGDDVVLYAAVKFGNPDVILFQKCVQQPGHQDDAIGTLGVDVPLAVAALETAELDRNGFNASRGSFPGSRDGEFEGDVTRAACRRSS